MFSKMLFAAAPAALLLAGCASDAGRILAQDTVERNNGLGTMRFLGTPSDANVLAVYPSAAMDRGVEGSAYVECRFTETGGFDSCFVLEETPEGWGFGAGALRVMTYYRWDPKVYPEMINTKARQRVWFRLP